MKPYVALGTTLYPDSEIAHVLSVLRAYNGCVARGWESKSVEGQMESFASDRRSSSQPALTEAQMERQRQRQMLLLSRTRVLHDMESSRNPRHVELLKNSLAFLEAKLKELGDVE